MEMVWLSERRLRSRPDTRPSQLRTAQPQEGSPRGQGQNLGTQGAPRHPWGPADSGHQSRAWGT